MDHDFPDTSKVVLLIIDMINDLEFEDGEKMLEPGITAAKQIAHFKKRLTQKSIPTIYVNDNFGKWRSDFRQLVEHTLHHGVRGEQIAKILEPEESDYFVIKTRHSGFYGTTLEILLQHLKAETLILAGMTGDICVQYTAQDAYMRRFKLLIPPDLLVCRDDKTKKMALDQLETNCKADLIPSTEIDLDRYV